jgi:tetratricopeptide (TPR) repeat protein
MVIDKKTYKQILINPHSLSYADSIELEKIIDRYPYFQSALILYVKLLKENNILHHNKLYQAAALTTDRSVLFRFLENQENFSNISKYHKENEEKNGNTKNTVSTFTQNIEPEKPSRNINTVSTPPETKKKMTYSQWLKHISQAGKTAPKKNNKQDPIFELIDRFLKDKPKIVPKKNYSAPPPASVIKSVEEKQMLMTETLANLYLKQKKYDKAIQAFRILSLKYPKKSSYFANQIQEIKKQLKR